MQVQEQRSTLREKGHWIMSTQTGLLHLTTSTEEQRFYINSLCFCTTPQQLFSDKPFSGHGNANNCVLAREEFVLVTCKTRDMHYEDGKAMYYKAPLPSQNQQIYFFPRHIFSCTLLHVDCN